MRRIKELREKRGISQLKLAIDLHLGQNSISRYETGEREVSNKVLVALADYFGVSTDYLLERTDDPSSDHLYALFLFVFLQNRHFII